MKIHEDTNTDEHPISASKTMKNNYIRRISHQLLLWYIDIKLVFRVIRNYFYK